MFLKNLILRGFKTFADKVELNFESGCGITAIVGPNGCGKSNIVDAFRFSLGEGNFRELRVNTLPEVIFAGTANRKPLSLAEATLIFDNTSRFLPVDYSEVLVRRRTFRSGESEFYINSQTCRLKDIRDLFLDTGLGSNALSIIGQGKVDAILSSEPEERRAVFEEVAGINKYKVRKREAEKKLILAEQNLLRIADLRVEIGEQLTVLESQAKAAREYKDLQQKVHDLELGIFKKQLGSLIDKKKTLEEHIHILKQKEKTLIEREKKVVEDKLMVRQKLKEIERENDLLSAQLDELKSKIEEEKSSVLLERERRLFEEQNKIRDLKEEERFLGYEIKRLNDSLADLGKKQAEFEERLEELKPQDLEGFGDIEFTLRLLGRLLDLADEIAWALYGKRSGLQGSLEGEDKGAKELYKAEIERLKSEEQLLKDNLSIKQEGSSKIAEKIQALSKVLREKVEDQAIPSKQLDELNQSKAGLIQKTQELRREKEELLLKLENLESGLLAAGEEVSDYSKEDLIKQEIALAKIEGELSQIIERIQSEYNFTTEELLSSPYEVPNVQKSKKEVETFKIRLRELEPVNLLAIEEYERSKERHLFISSQYQDVVSAHENLKNLITDLDLKAREDFIKCMQVVSENFKKIFSSLFEGGEARLDLQKEKDPLEAGIEISVCPSGRKWLNMSLLSGGERSLTAIAILFAFLKTQPSPLCILDEVDAALDDANIDRFARFLKGFSEKTQILIITHNKRTMEVADIIYGITMEEAGVSKVVSMRLLKVGN